MGLSLIIPLAISGASAGLQLLFAPKIKQEPVDKGKLNDIRVTGVELGSPISRYWGDFRAGGNIVATGGVQHSIVTTPSSGGKGGGGSSAPATRTHTYRYDCAVALARGEISSIGRIMANTDVVVDPDAGQGSANYATYEAEDGVISGGASVVTSGGIPNRDTDDYVTGLGNGGKVVLSVSTLIQPPTPEEPPNPSSYSIINYFYKNNADQTAEIKYNGGSAKTVDFLDSGGNWALKTDIEDGFVTSIDFENPSASAPDLDYVTVQLIFRTDRFPVDSFEITQMVNPDVLYPPDPLNPSEWYNFKPTADAQGQISAQLPDGGTIEFYTGTETQLQDPTIEAIIDARYGSGEGALRLSAMRGISYFVLDDYKLRTPNVPNFTAVIHEGTTSVQTICEEILDEIGFTSSDYDFSALSGDTVVGFGDLERQTRRQLISYLQLWKQFRLAEVGDKVVAVKENRASDYTVVADTDLRAHYAGGEVPAYDSKTTAREEHTMTKDVIVQYLEKDRDYHNDGQQSDELFDISATKTEERAFPIVEQKSEAKRVANILRDKEYAESNAFEFSGMPTLAKYGVGSVLTIPKTGRNWTVRIERASMPLPIGPISFEGVSTDQEVFDPNNDIAPNKKYDLERIYSFPRNSKTLIIESEPIRDNDRGKKGVYIASGGIGFGKWNGGTIYREVDADDYQYEMSLDSPSPMFISTDSENLSAHSPTTSEDTTSSFTMYFYDDDVPFSTVTQAELDKHPTLNLVRIADEWVQVRTVTPVSVDKLKDGYGSAFTGTNLWRGRFGTSAPDHAKNEDGFLVTRALRFMELDTVDESESIVVKGASAYQDLDNVSSVSKTFTGIQSEYTATNGSPDRVVDLDDMSINEIGDLLEAILRDTNLKS